MAGAVPGGFRLEIRARFFPQIVLGAAQAPQGMGTAPRLPELQECLDTRDAQGGVAEVSVPWMIPVGPFHGVCDPTRVQTGDQSRAGNVTMPWMRAGIQSTEQQIPNVRLSLKEEGGRAQELRGCNRSSGSKPHPSHPSKDKEGDKGASLCLKKLCLYHHCSR